MNNKTERNMGAQPLTSIMDEKNLTAHDLVAASDEQITHKMIARARKGRRLSRNVQFKILRALINTSETQYALKDIFNY